MKMKYHNFHMVSMSPWPILNSLMAWNLVSSMSYSFYYSNNMIILLNTIITIITASLWWKNTIQEALMQGFHHFMVIKGLKLGMILFITSEIFFFVSFFWAYFHSSINPTIEIGMMWPPKSIMAFDPMNVPLLNTIILVSSGVSITWSHHSIVLNNKNNAIKTLMITCILGVLFSILQWMEYKQASFSIFDSSYGSTFFMATGFHGLHVLIGTTFLMICLNRMLNNSMSMKHSIGFDMAAWYWHFVDIIWLFLYLSIYWWGN